MKKLTTAITTYNKIVEIAKRDSKGFIKNLKEVQKVLSLNCVRTSNESYEETHPLTVIMFYNDGSHLIVQNIDQHQSPLIILK